MIFNPEIFRAYDIRGVYGRDFDDKFAFVLGQAATRYFNAKKMLIARDSRSFSEKLGLALADGANTLGCVVEDIGLSTTPFFNFALKNSKANFGVMITASHNPAEYGGFKIYDKNGMIAGLYSGLDEINKILDSGTIKLANIKGGRGNIDLAKLMREYLKYIVFKSKIRKGELGGIKIKVSGPKTVLNEINLLTAEIDLNINNEKWDIGFSFDEDSDRLIVSNSTGEIIRNDFIVGLLVKNSARFLLKPKIIYDVHFSKGVIGKFNEWGVKSYKSRIGRFFVRDAMIKHRADIGGEISGHIYFKENNQSELPLLAMLRLLRILVLSKMDINEMVKPFQTWFNSGRMDFRIRDADEARKILDKIEKRFSDGTIEKIDGVTVEYIDPEKMGADSEKYWWFNIRASNTEPLVRLLVEAKSKETLDQRVSEISRLIEEESLS